MRQCKWQSRTKDSQQPDTSVSWTTTSLCTHAVEPPCTERYARWCERSVTQLMGDLLLDLLGQGQGDRKSSKAVCTSALPSQMRRTAYWPQVKTKAFSTRSASLGEYCLKRARR